jgi:hypothetical protein
LFLGEPLVGVVGGYELLGGDVVDQSGAIYTFALEEKKNYFKI